MTLAIAVAYSLYIFPSEPDLDAFEAGQSLGRRVNRNDFAKVTASDSGSAEIIRIDQILGKDRVDLGWWNEGFRKVPVEYGIELSPRLLSKWMGYLSSRELWSIGELNSRWSSIRAKGDGKRAWLIALSAFPTKTKFGLGDDESQSTEETKSIKFVLDSSMGRTEPSARMIHERRAQSRHELDQVPWWQFTPFGRELTFEFAKPYETPIIERGEFYRTWWLLWTESDLGKGPATIKIASQRKIRTAVFP